MKENLSLQETISALDKFDYDKKQISGLENARNTSQMKNYLSSLDYSYKRLTCLQDAVNELVEETKEQLKKQENVQTYKTKIINLSRLYNISFDEVVDIMRQQTNK